MNIEEILPIFDRQCRVEIEYPGVRKDVLPHLVRFVRSAPGMCFILYSSLDEKNADEAIRDQIEYFRPLNRPLQWKVYGHDKPADLVKRLGAQGFKIEVPDAVMILDLQKVPPSLLEKDQVDIKAITLREDLKDVVTVMEQVWGGNFDWIYERLGGHLEIPGYLSVYAAYMDGQPVSAAWIYFHEGSFFADLWAGSTIEAYRNRGLYSALLGVRVREAIRRGFRFLTIDAGPMSRPIVARHGFEFLVDTYDCEWHPEPQSNKEGEVE
jgi:GNAT superfamily N-acetyltransferase